MQGIGFWASNGEYLLYNKTQAFQRNNCSSGQTGSFVNFTRQYVGINEDQLLRLINEDTANFNAAGQANANASGTCSSTCAASTTTRLTGPFVAMDSSNVYLSGDFPASPNTLDSPVGCYSVNRSVLMSGTGAISSTPYIHNISTKPVYPFGSNSGYRLIQTGNTFELRVGSGSSKCVESISMSNLPIGAFTPQLVFDYKYFYGGPGNSMNGLYYLVLTANSVLAFYFCPEAGSPYLIGNCSSPSGYGFRAGSNGALTRAFILISSDLSIRVVALSRRYDSGLSSFDSTDTRTLIWQASKDFFGAPTTITNIYDQFNSSRLWIHAACAFGSGNYAVFYSVRTGLFGSRTYGTLVGSGDIAGAGLAGSDDVLSAIGDGTNIFLKIQGQTLGQFIRYYNVASNSWFTGRTNL